MKYKYLLFDADNTLFDFNTSEKRAFLALSVIDSKVFVVENYELYHKINDLMWKRLERREITKPELKFMRFRELFRQLSLEVSEKTLAEIVTSYQNNLALGTDLLSGAEETVKNLSADHEIYIVTNGISYVQTNRLNASALKGYVKKLFISEDIGVEKPSTKFFDYVIDTVGDPDRSAYVVIGDSLSSDIDGAIASKIDSVYLDPNGIGTKGREVTRCITSIKQLPHLLRNM